MHRSFGGCLPCSSPQPLSPSESTCKIGEFLVGEPFLESIPATAVTHRLNFDQKNSMQFETSSIKMDLDQYGVPFFAILLWGGKMGKKEQTSSSIKSRLIRYQTATCTTMTVMIKGSILYGLMCSGYASHHSILGHTFYTHVFSDRLLHLGRWAILALFASQSAINLHLISSCLGLASRETRFPCYYTCSCLLCVSIGGLLP